MPLIAREGVPEVVVLISTLCKFSGRFLPWQWF
jgi:hypothetical protein